MSELISSGEIYYRKLILLGAGKVIQKLTRDYTCKRS